MNSKNKKIQLLKRIKDIFNKEKISELDKLYLEQMGLGFKYEIEDIDLQEEKEVVKKITYGEKMVDLERIINHLKTHSGIETRDEAINYLASFGFNFTDPTTGIEYNTIKRKVINVRRPKFTKKLKNK